MKLFVMLVGLLSSSVALSVEPENTCNIKSISLNSEINCLDSKLKEYSTYNVEILPESKGKRFACVRDLRAQDHKLMAAIEVTKNWSSETVLSYSGKNFNLNIDMVSKHNDYDYKSEVFFQSSTVNLSGSYICSINPYQ